MTTVAVYTRRTVDSFVRRTVERRRSVVRRTVERRRTVVRRTVVQRTLVVAVEMPVRISRMFVLIVRFVR